MWVGFYLKWLVLNLTGTKKCRQNIINGVVNVYKQKSKAFLGNFVRLNVVTVI